MKVPNINFLIIFTHLQIFSCRLAIAIG